MTPDIIAKLSKVVTVYPQEGESRVNLNTADPLVLQALDPRITQSMAAEIVQARPFKTIQELDRVSSFEAIGKELRLQNLYDIKSDLFLARMIGERERSDQECDRGAPARSEHWNEHGAVLPRPLTRCHSDPALATKETSTSRTRPNLCTHRLPERY